MIHERTWRSALLLLLRFGREFQRMAFLAAGVGAFGRLALCNIAGEGSDDTGAAELAFQQVLGLWGATRSIFALSLLDHQIDRAEGYITDVAVLSPYRRRGVAQALLARAEEEARVRRSLLAGWILHQRAWVFMRKDLI